MNSAIHKQSDTNYFSGVVNCDRLKCHEVRSKVGLRSTILPLSHRNP